MVKRVGMDKTLLLEQMISALEETHQGAVEAALRAYNTATNDENVAENQYDTLALEASYLAHGQAQRVAECEADILAFKKLNIADDTEKKVVTLGCLIQLIDEDDNNKYVFFAPSAGGLKVRFDEKDIIVVTPTSPLGEALIGRELHDDVDVHVGNQIINYEIALIS
jgi:transcription elongation GreA/GreB family factor